MLLPQWVLCARYLVLDEADKMLQAGWEPQLEAIAQAIGMSFSIQELNLAGNPIRDAGASGPC